MSPTAVASTVAPEEDGEESPVDGAATEGDGPAADGDEPPTEPDDPALLQLTRMAPASSAVAMVRYLSRMCLPKSLRA